MILDLARWGGALVVGLISGFMSGRMYRKLYKSFREEVSRMEEQFVGARKELAELKYRMDIFEGKHLRARNLGFGLPQSRLRDKNGD